MTAVPSRHALFLLALLLATPLRAQPAGPSAEQLKSWIVLRQQRVEVVHHEIQQMDAHLASRLDVIMETLTSISDSSNSGTKVARVKEDTMKRLRKVIEAYDQKRSVMRQELRNPETVLTAEDKRKIVAAFDERIAQRTQQILALHHSMPGYQDHEQYRATGDAYFARNAEYEQNRRMNTHSKAQRDALIKELDASIARLGRIGQALQTQLAATTDPALRKERAEDVARNDALIAERRQQRLDVLTGAGTDGRAVPLNQAMDLDRALKKSIDELRRDFNTFFARYHTYVSELTALRATEATHKAALRGG